MLPVTTSYVLEHREALESHDIPVYRVLRSPSGELRAEAVPPGSALEVPVAERDKKTYLVDREWMHKVFSEEDPFEAELEELAEVGPQERTRALSALKTSLAALKAEAAAPMVQAQAIMDTVTRAFLLNKASLRVWDSGLGPQERTLARETTSIVGTVVEMAENPAVVSGLLTLFQGLSNGQTVNHVTRVFATYTGFLKYYNHLHQQRLPQALRRVFPSVYLPHYRAILPGVPEHLLVSDQVLQLPAFDAFATREFALGAFLHDIGKMGNIDYFESDATYDAKQIQQHVFLSAGLILENYGTEHEGARLLAGDHHNALGHPQGYGLTRWERERGSRPPVETVRSLSGLADGFVSGQALGWLPVEMLAVADVYDAMIDDSRSYKKPMSPALAVVFLEDTMAAQGKLDPVLVDLYIDFLRTQKRDVPDDRGFLFKTRHSSG